MICPPVLKGGGGQAAGRTHQILSLARVEVTIRWARNRSSPYRFLGVWCDVRDRDG